MPLAIFGSFVTSAVAAQGSPAPVALSLSSSGALSVSLSVVDPNGSALRYAIDGNFTPLIDSLPLNASMRDQVLVQIAVAQAAAPSLFGNHDGQVSSNEVTLFEHLLVRGASLLPGSSMVTGSAALSLTLDRSLATATQLTGVVLTGATGPVASNASIVIVSDLLYQFGFTGSSHVLTLSTNLSAVAPGLGLLAPTVELTFQTPAGYTILGSSGLSGTTTTNDVFGFGAGSISGTYTAANTTQVTIQFDTSFPLGYVLIGVIVAGVAVALGLLVIRRRRRRKRLAEKGSSPSAPSGDGSVGPSGSE